MGWGGGGEGEGEVWEDMEEKGGRMDLIHWFG